MQCNTCSMPAWMFQLMNLECPADHCAAPVQQSHGSFWAQRLVTALCMAAMQATKEAAAQEALALRQEVEHVMARHQERVAKWEQAAAADEAQLHQRQAAIEV